LNLFVYEHTHSAERRLIKTDKHNILKGIETAGIIGLQALFATALQTEPLVSDTLNQAGIFIERPTQAVCFKLEQLGSTQTDQNLSKKLCFF